MLARRAAREDPGLVETVSAVPPRSTPDLVGYVLATLIACGVFALSLAAMSTSSVLWFFVVAPITFIYALLPAALIGALAAVAIELLAWRTTSVLLQTALVAAVGSGAGYVLLQQVEIAVLIGLAGIVGRLGAEVARR